MKHFNDTKTFTEYSNNMDNIDEYNARKKRKRSIVFDDMIADMLSNNIRNSIVTELFIRGRKPLLLILLCNHMLNYKNMLD